MNKIFFEKMDSTNKYVKDNFFSLEDFSVCIAKEQTNGKGRGERNFLSKKGGAYFSILIKPPFNFDVLSLTPIMAVAAKRGIKKATGKDVSIKWVNDLIYDGKKVSGILTEAITKDNKIESIVIGCGINVNEPIDGFGEISNIATSLYKQDGEVEKVINEVVESFINIYSKKEDIFNEYKDSLISLGKEVIVTKNNREAKAVDLDDSFGLIVEYLDGTRETVFTGEINLK